MKPFQKAILTIITVIGISEFTPKVINLFNKNKKVIVGDVWECMMHVMIFENNNEVGSTLQKTTRKVIAVDGDEITYVIPEDSTRYKMDIDEFTFNGAGMTNSIN